MMLRPSTSLTAAAGSCSPGHSPFLRAACRPAPARGPAQPRCQAPTGSEPEQAAPEPAVPAAAPPAASSATSAAAPPAGGNGGALAGGAVGFGVALFLVARLTAGGPSFAALESESVPLDAALRNGRPTVVEFYADW